MTELSSLAVWDGRFQPLHRGHVAVIEAILQQFDCDLVVMIIQSSEGSQNAYGAEVNKHHLLSRNPLTFWERFNLLKLATQNLKQASKVNILGIPRPDLFWDIAKAFYPDNRFICLTGKDEYEQRKKQFWSSLGEQTRIVDISTVPTISATELKIALKSGRSWESFLPDGTLEYFKSINGPQRFADADI